MARKFGFRGAALLAVLTAVPGAAQAPPPPLDSLDQYVERTRQLWGIPGVAVAVVRADSVVWAAGFGVRRLGDTARVNPNTMFAVGSVTKSFTAALLGLLVDEGRLGWDDRVVDRLPGFALADSAAAADLRIRDLLTHRTGVPSSNLMFWGSDLPRAEVIRRARFLPVRWPPRTRFEYHNVMYAVAGQVVPAATGRSWEAELRRRIFVPLGMTRSEPGGTDLARFRNVAAPHALVDGVLRPIPVLDLDNAAPAGSIYSTVLDLARYLRWQLRAGSFDGRRLLADSIVTELHRPQIEVPRDGLYGGLMPDAARIHYGLGWFTHDYHGHRVVEHGGQTDGMHATVALLPDRDVGVVVLTNSAYLGFPAAIANRVFDAVLGRPPRDWSAGIGAALATMNGPGRGLPPPPDPVEAPTRAPHLATGRYHHPLYGDAVVTGGADGMWLELLGRRVALRHWSDDRYRPDWRPDDTMIRAMLGLAAFVGPAGGPPQVLRFPAIGDFDRVARP